MARHDWVCVGVRSSPQPTHYALAALSSFRNKPLPEDLVVFGEVGLAGEIRPVLNGQERLKEAVKHGFKKAIVPKANAPKKRQSDMDILAAQRLSEVIDWLA